MDIGCGDGSFLQVAQTCGWDVIGIDPDPKVVANCRSQGWNVLQGDIEQFYDKERLFDVITMNHVIEHVHDPLAVLKACHRLLKPGGQLWLETPNIDSFGHLQYGRNWRGLEPPRHLLLFNQRSLLTALLAAGFTSQSNARVVKTNYHGLHGLAKLSNEDNVSGVTSRFPKRRDC